jgi:hypothetical protein
MARRWRAISCLFCYRYLRLQLLVLESRSGSCTRSRSDRNPDGVGETREWAYYGVSVRDYNKGANGITNRERGGNCAVCVTEGPRSESAPCA